MRSLERATGIIRYAALTHSVQTNSPAKRPDLQGERPIMAENLADAITANAILPSVGENPTLGNGFMLAAGIIRDGMAC